MLKKILNLNGVATLSKIEQKSINGGRNAEISPEGDSCESWINGVHYTGLSVADAQGDYQFCVDNGYSGCGYCCASC